jgi:hypothetical protein
MTFIEKPPTSVVARCREVTDYLLRDAALRDLLGEVKIDGYNCDPEDAVFSSKTGGDLFLIPATVTLRSIKPREVPGYEICEMRQCGGGYWEPPDYDLYPLETCVHFENTIFRLITRLAEEALRGRLNRAMNVYYKEHEDRRVAAQNELLDDECCF